jgi:transposase
LVKQRTRLVNMLRSHMAEFGIVAPKGIWRVAELRAIIGDQSDERLPDPARQALGCVVQQLAGLEANIEKLEGKIVKQCKRSEASMRLVGIPGIGPIAATALVASIQDASQFKSGRHFAAWLGLTPKRNASGLRDRKGRISKMGNPYLRTLLVLGATAVVGHAKRSKRPSAGFAARLLEKAKPVRLITVALANKMARIVWALLTKGEAYRSLPAHQGDTHRLLAASLA